MDKLLKFGFVPSAETLIIFPVGVNVKLKIVEKGLCSDFKYILSIFFDNFL